MNIELLNWSRGVIADQEITTTQKTIAWAIMIHANLVTRLCNPGTAALVKATGLTERCVWIGIKALADRGWLINHHGGGNGKKNDFQFNFPLHLRQKITESEGQTLNRKVPNPESEGTQTLNRKVGTLYTGNIEEKSEVKYSASEASDLFRENNSIDGRSETVSASTSRRRGPKPQLYTTEFEAFWKVYPRRQGKTEASIAFNDALADGATSEAIVAGAKRYAVYCDQAKFDPRMIKMAQGWLNGSRWSDEYHVRQKSERLDQSII